MSILNNYSISELKEALLMKINYLKNRYKYTGISAYDFDQITENAIKDMDKLFSLKSNISIDNFFESRVDIYMSAYIRKKLICSNSIINSYINESNINFNNRIECNSLLESINKIYNNSFYTPSYTNINSLFESSKKINEILLTYCKCIKDYKNIPDIIKTYIEVYIDRNNIDLFSLLFDDNNTNINRLNDICSSNNKSIPEYISIKKSLLNHISEMFDNNDKIMLENIINDYIDKNSNIKLGLMLNTIRIEINKNTNKYYYINEFINGYDKHLEFALMDNFNISTKILKKGLYKYLSEYSDDEIENVIKEIPPKYLMVLYNFYGKSLRYYNFNMNLVDDSLKKLSVVLVTIKDYLKYKNNKYEPIKVDDYDSINLDNDLGAALDDLKRFGYYDILSQFTLVERIAITLKLGYVNNKEYSNVDIANFLDIDQSKINEILYKFLNMYKSKVINDVDNIINSYKKIKK